MNFTNKARFLVLLFVIFSLTIYSKDSSHIRLGGALRFNYNYSDWIDEGKKLGGVFGYDVFRLNATGGYKDLIFDAEYRYYAPASGGGMLKHGWMGYRFNSEHQVQIGLNTVPFGIMPYNSSNWFFSINYYLGLEDDADMGIKYSYLNDDWSLDVAFYKNSDILAFHSTDGIVTSRYGYDIAGRNKEVNQGNLRIARRWGGLFLHEIGASAQIGGIYNIDTREIGSRSAFALHYVLKHDGWNLKVQFSSYKMSPKNQDNINDQVEMAAYGANYNVASKADTYTLGVSYNLPVNKNILDDITFYNDIGMMKKDVSQMKSSYQNVTGMMLAMGPIHAYLDYATGKNHAWLGEEWTNAFAEGGKTNKWSARLNLNIGYYF